MPPIRRYPGYPIIPPRRIETNPFRVPLDPLPTVRVANPAEFVQLRGRFVVPAPFTDGPRQNFFPSNGDPSTSVLSRYNADFNWFEFDIIPGATPNGYAVPWQVNVWISPVSAAFEQTFTIVTSARPPSFISGVPQNDYILPTLNDPANSSLQPNGLNLISFYGATYRNVFLEARFRDGQPSYPGSPGTNGVGVLQGEIRAGYDPDLVTFRKGNL
jgi:hypothetical protein